MRAIRHSSLLVAAIGSLAICAACAAGSSPGSRPPASVTPAPVPSGSGDPRPLTVPGVVPAPHWPIPGVDAGNTATPTPGPDGLIDVAWAWGSLAWSPDGTTLAAAAESQEAGEGQIHLFDRTGHPVGAVPGWRAAWIDDHDLMTLERNADGAGYSAWRWSSDDRTSALVAPNAGDLLGSSRGRVALEFWSADSAAPTFRVWTREGLSAALPGSPAAWSPDGRMLAVLRDASTANDPTSPRVALASTGSAAPVWLQVLDGSDLRPLVAFPASRFDPRTSVLFDSSGTWIAASAFAFDLAHGVADALPPPSEAVAWGADGRLILASFDDHTIAAWDPTTHTLSAPFAPGTRLPTPDHQVITVPPRTGEWPQLVTPGVVSPDGALRAWSPPANGLGNTPLRLVPVAAARP
jgi:WD40 repeat protein